MTRDDILALFARRNLLWNAHDARGLAADHLEGGVVESPLAGGEITGSDKITKVYQKLFDTFTDLRLEQEELTIDGDRVALLASVTGTDNGGFMGLSPTGRPARVGVAFFYRLLDGRIAEERRVYDFSGLLIQIGVLKAKPV